MSHRVEPNASQYMRTRARTLRKDATIPERIVWGLLRNRRLGGLKFRRQEPIGLYVVDFLCESARLVVELDGESHQGQGREDEIREEYLKSRGLRVLRITNDQVLYEREAVRETIFREADGDGCK